MRLFAFSGPPFSPFLEVAAQRLLALDRLE